MKKLLKIFAVTALIVCLAFNALACSNNPNNNDPSGGGKKTTLKITVFDAGYGIDYLKRLGSEFSRINKDVEVVITPTAVPTQTLSAISGGVYACDIFMGITNLAWWFPNDFIDLTPVYESTPDGENKPVKDKVDPNVYQALKTTDGKLLAMPWGDCRMTLMYNKTTLDALMGTDYELPRTTREFWALANEIKRDHRSDAYVYTTWNEEDYNVIFLETLWAQYDYDSFTNYQLGRYMDESGNTVDDPTGEHSLAAPGKLKALQFCEQLLKKSNGYTHTYSDAMEFMESQAAWLGYGYGNDMKDVVFCLNGTWIEREIGDFLAASDAQLMAMKMPVLSDCIENCTTVTDDAELSALIKAIDEGSAVQNGELYEGEGFSVNAADYAYIAEARSYVGNVQTAQQCGIPANARNIELAQEFLRFYASNQASQLAMQELNGITLPYGYQPQNIEAFSATTQSFYQTFENSTLVISQASAPTVWKGLALVHNTHWGMELFAGTESAQKLYTDDLLYYRNMWDIITGRK